MVIKVFNSCGRSKGVGNPLSIRKDCSWTHQWGQSCSSRWLLQICGILWHNAPFTTLLASGGVSSERPPSHWKHRQTSRWEFPWINPNFAICNLNSICWWTSLMRPDSKTGTVAEAGSMELTGSDDATMDGPSNQKRSQWNCSVW